MDQDDKITAKVQKPRLGSSALVTDDHGRLLLGKRAKEPHRNKWVLPGGGVKIFETIAEAAARELAEETGLLVAVGNVLTLREIINVGTEHRLIIFSAAKVVSGKLTGGSDLAELTFFQRADLENLALSAVVREVLTELGWIGVPTH